MLRDWDEKFPGRVESIFSSICNASASQLADPALFDFARLETLRAEWDVNSSAAGAAPAASAAIPAVLDPILP
jgi:tRNA 2-thiocytidine biosynthesis protein TtcA